MAGPRQIVDAPTFSPSPYGLLSVVQTPPNDGAHWQNGVTWTSFCPNAAQATYDECITVTGSGGPPPEPSIKAANVEMSLRGAIPFTPYVRFDCATVGNEAAVETARDALARTEGLQVERSFWTGVADGDVVVFPHLAANAEVIDSQGILLQTVASPPVTGGPFDIAEGLGLLEQGLANCFGGVGVIHMPVKLVPTLDALGLLRVVNARNVGSGQFDRQLQTLNGNLVAAGAGYPGTGPNGAAPTNTTTWMYATGPVFMRRSDVKIMPATSTINRETNNIEMIAERTYVLGFDCCHVAIQVNMSTP